MTGAVTEPRTAQQPADRWRRWRRVAFVVCLMLLAAVGLAVAASQERRGYLDPAGVDSGGSRALARLLASQGVQIDEVRTTDDAAASGAPGTTLLVTVPDLLRSEQVLRLVRTGADLVLVEPTSIVSDFSSAVESITAGSSQVRDAACEMPEAERAGSARVGGVGYEAPASFDSCYPADDAASLVVGPADDGGRLVVLGTGALLTNRFLDEDGNASLALGLLGSHPRLVWYRPTLGELEAGPRSFTELLPDRIAPVVWQLGVAVVLAALWRARRLGPVVTEPIPVVVRAAEATEGRARLYRRGRARDHAAAALRDACVTRLRSRLGLPPDSGAKVVADAVAARTGHPAAAVEAALAGPPPADDADLVRLADSLDMLEQEVRTR